MTQKHTPDPILSRFLSVSARALGLTGEEGTSARSSRKSDARRGKHDALYTAPADCVDAYYPPERNRGDDRRFFHL